MRLVRLQQPKPPKRWPRRVGYMLLAFVLAASILFVNALRPLPNAAIHFTLPKTDSADQLQLQWPATGEAAIAADGYDLLASHGDSTPLATASIAKIITALCVLQKYPIAPGKSGPTLTFGQQDVAYYQYQVQQGGSSVPVYPGGTMTEYEELEAMLIPSANNIADSLATWAFGTLDNYAAYANSFVLQHGLVNTHIGVDASGFDPSTVSTASDLAELGLLARANPVIMSIASQKSVVLPGVGTVDNYNTALGINGINGLKTGNNDQDKGALLFTANIQVDGKTMPISGAVMGQPSLQDALSSSAQLVGSIGANFEPYTYVTKGQIIGEATTAWGTRVPIRAASAATITRWKGYAVKTARTIHPTPANKAASIGALEVVSGPTAASVTVVLDHSASSPSIWWRATRL